MARTAFMLYNNQRVNNQLSLSLIPTEISHQGKQLDFKRIRITRAFIRDILSRF